MAIRIKTKQNMKVGISHVSCRSLGYTLLLFPAGIFLPSIPIKGPGYSFKWLPNDINRCEDNQENTVWLCFCNLLHIHVVSFFLCFTFILKYLIKQSTQSFNKLDLLWQFFFFKFPKINLQFLFLKSTKGDVFKISVW